MTPTTEPRNNLRIQKALEEKSLDPRAYEKYLLESIETQQ